MIKIQSPLCLHFISSRIFFSFGNNYCTCDASDNDSIKFVELWIDSLSTGIKDSSSPYEFSWNTVPYQDSTEHLLMVKAEDINNNISFSTSVLVLVDNSNSYPQSLNIKTINYTQTEMTITINSTIEEDFLNYKLLTSDNIDSQKYPLLTLTNISDTIIKIYDFNPRAFLVLVRG